MTSWSAPELHELPSSLGLSSCVLHLLRTCCARRRIPGARLDTCCCYYISSNPTHPTKSTSTVELHHGREPSQIAQPGRWVLVSPHACARSSLLAFSFFLSLSLLPSRPRAAESVTASPSNAADGSLAFPKLPSNQSGWICKPIVDIAISIRSGDRPSEGNQSAGSLQLGLVSHKDNVFWIDFFGFSVGFIFTPRK